MFLSHRIIQLKGSCNILEIGTFDGFNARLLVESNAKIQVTTIDIPSRDIRSGGTYAKLKTYDNYQVKHQTFFEVGRRSHGRKNEKY